MNVNDFVDGLFFGGGTNMVGPDGHTNDFDTGHSDYTEDGPKTPGCPACEGRWDDETGTFA